MHTPDEIIELARRSQSITRLTEDIQHQVSRVSLEEQQKFQSAIADLDATRTKEIFQIIETATEEKATMREILKRIADYLLPQPAFETPLGFANESPFVTAQILLEQFGTFTPTRQEFESWQNRRIAFSRLRAAGVELIRKTIGI
ncbi:MAG: hypothetical protein PUP93_26845 [Rhizonema sp. NSF051]|nr:hypothetical protein [Rhizonema sp. NSF051]